MGYEGPRTDLRNALRKRIDLTFSRGCFCNLTRHVVFVHMPGARKVLKDRPYDFRVLCRRDAPIIRQSARIPKLFHLGAPYSHFTNVPVPRQVFENAQVRSRKSLRKPRDCWRLLKRSFQGVDAREVDICRAPLQYFHRLETMRFDRFDESIRERIDLTGYTESAVAQMTASSACNLSHLSWGQIPVLKSIEFAALGESDMVYVEVETHTDSVCRYEIVHLTRLVELDLSIAGAGAKGAENDRGATALTTDELANRVDLISGESHDGRATRQARDLFWPRIGQHRHARTADDGNAFEQALQNPAHCRRAQEERLLPATQIDETICEDVPALKVRSELDLVYRDEGRIGIAWQSFHRAHRVAGTRGDDLLFAGDERNIGFTDAACHFAIHFTRQETQRQSDDTGRMSNHSFDRQMRLTGIGWTQHRCHTAPVEGDCVVFIKLDVHSQHSCARPSTGEPYRRHIGKPQRSNRQKHEL